MKYLTRPVVYLENEDFDDDGNILDKSKPVFILLQSTNCGHCTHAKPTFHDFAVKNPHILCATIQMDSPNITREFHQKMDKIYPGLWGFPSYILHWNGIKEKYEGDRSYDDIDRFIKRNV
jgi:hypothetical protein